MPVYTKALTAKLSELDPDNKDYYDQQFQIFNDDFVALTDLIAEIKKNHSGSVLIGTEPVFNYMSDALGMKMVGLGFQLSIMNDTEPSSKDVAYFEAQLTNHTAKVLIYNAQVSNPMTERMQNLAIAQGIPIVGVTETQPPGKTYLEWMRSQLNDLKEALSQE
jgi:zinc/manganese transport system substrate-binding protein